MIIQQMFPKKYLNEQLGIIHAGCLKHDSKFGMDKKYQTSKELFLT